MAGNSDGEDVSAMVPPKKRGAAAVAGGEADPKRARGASGRAARAAGRGHEDEQPQADVVHLATELAPEPEAGKGKRARKPTAKQAAAAQEVVMEQAAAQEATASVAVAEEQQQPVQQEVAAAVAPPAVAAAAVGPPQQEPPPELTLLAKEDQPQQQQHPDQQQQDQLQQQQQQQQEQQQHGEHAVADAATAAQAPYPAADALQQQQQQQVDLAAADPAAAAVAASTHMQAADTAQQQQPVAQQQQGMQPQYDPAQQQQQQQLQQHIDPAHLQQLYAQQPLDPHAQGAMQADAAGGGDLQALFDTSALVLGIALVVLDPQGSGAEQQWESVSMPVPPHSTIYDLRQRIAHTGLHGSTFAPEQQGLSIVTAGGDHITLQDYDASGQLATLEQYGLVPGGTQSHTVYLRGAGHNMLAQPHDPAQQHEQPELNPDGTEKKKRRQHTRWKEEEVMRLLEGVEALGVGHWRQMQRDYQLEHRTDVDLKDKWRNITKAIGQHKKMRGFNMAADLVLRVQNCMRVAAEKRAAKQANEGGHAPGMELATLEQQQQQQQQQQQGMPHDADAAAQAAAEGAAVQGVLDGALPQVHQVEGDVHVDVMDSAAGHYQQQLQGIEHQDPQQQLPQQQQHDAGAALPTQQDPHTQQDPAHQDPGMLAADPQQQQEQEHHQQQYHDAGHEHDPGAVVLPVPHFDDMGPGAQGEEAAQVASPPASGALPTAPPLDI